MLTKHKDEHDIWAHEEGQTVFHLELVPAKCRKHQLIDLNKLHGAIVGLIKISLISFGFIRGQTIFLFLH